MRKKITIEFNYTMTDFVDDINGEIDDAFIEKVKKELEEDGYTNVVISLENVYESTLPKPPVFNK